MLAGLNGSGKSAIFDAVTYALFGHHRGGGQQADELINKDSDALLVEFDFLLDGQTLPSQAHRATRQQGRRQRHAADLPPRVRGDNGEGKWVPVEGTGQQERVRRPGSRSNIGLNYETFTSSVLLLQGKAEKLLDSSRRAASRCWPASSIWSATKSCTKTPTTSARRWKGR